MFEIPAPLIESQRQQRRAAVVRAGGPRLSLGLAYRDFDRMLCLGDPARKRRLHWTLGLFPRNILTIVNLQPPSQSCHPTSFSPTAAQHFTLPKCANTKARAS